MESLKSIKTLLFLLSLLIQFIAYFMPWFMFFLEPRTGTQIQGGWLILLYLAVALISVFRLKKTGMMLICFFSSLPLVLTIGAAIYLGLFPTTGLFLKGLWITLGCFLYQMLYSMVALIMDQKSL